MASVQPHFSGVKLAKILEKVFNLEDYQVVMPFVALAEQGEGQKYAQVLEEQLHQSTMTATGQGEDYDMTSTGGPPPPQSNAMNLQRQPAASASPKGTIASQ